MMRCVRCTCNEKAGPEVKLEMDEFRSSESLWCGDVVNEKSPGELAESTWGEIERATSTTSNQGRLISTLETLRC